MSLLTTAYLMERYGPLLTEEQLGEVLHLSSKTVRNYRVRGDLPVKGIKTGAHWVFHAQDVAAHVDGLRGLAGRAA